MPLTNVASRSTDPQKLTAYQTSKSERPVIRPYIPAGMLTFLSIVLSIIHRQLFYHNQHGLILLIQSK